MPQNKANQWLHTLLPVLQTALKTLGDTPARSMEQLAQRLGCHPLPDTSTVMAEASAGDTKQEKHDPADPPLFAMMGPNDAESRRHPIRMSRKAILAARKNAIP